MSLTWGYFFGALFLLCCSTAALIWLGDWISGRSVRPSVYRMGDRT